MFKRNPKIDSKSYIHTRKAHESELAEDYVELIEDLINKEGEARIVDIANHLGISKATANQAISRLVKKGFLKSKPYRAIYLTKKGENTALHARQRHKIVYDFTTLLMKIWTKNLAGVTLITFLNFNSLITFFYHKYTRNNNY